MLPYSAKVLLFHGKALFSVRTNRSRSLLGGSHAILLQLLATDVFCRMASPCCRSDFRAVLVAVRLPAVLYAMGVRGSPQARSSKAAVVLHRYTPGDCALVSSSPRVPRNCSVLAVAARLRKLKKSLAVMNLSLTSLDPTQAQLAEWFSGKVSFPIPIHSYKVSFSHSNVLISLKCFGSIFLLQCHFLKISMFPWKIWIMSKIHSQREDIVRKMSTSSSSERSHSLTKICGASFFLR